MDPGAGASGVGALPTPAAVSAVVGQVLCQQPCPGHGSWGTVTLRTPTTAHLGWGKHPLGKQELTNIPNIAFSFALINQA